MTQKIPVITIDGPSGSGKGTISQLVSQHLGYHLLNSGALYRALALAALDKDVALGDESRLAELAKNLDVQFIPVETPNLGVSTKIVLNGKNITDQLQLETTGNAASKISIFPAVRQALVDRQKNFLKAPGLVAEGRDMGTVIFPQAQVKIFLDASAEERATRRYNQLLAQGINVKLSDLISEVANRDLRDRTRKVAPLKAAEDAIIIDTTNLSIDQVFGRIINILELKR